MAEHAMAEHVMAEQYNHASGGTKWSPLGETLHLPETAQCFTKVASLPPRAILSGRQAPLTEKGREAPHDLSNPADEEDEEEHDEEDERALLSLGCELVSLKQADVVEQHGEQRVIDPSLAHPVPAQRQNTPAVSGGSPDNFGFPSQNVFRGAATLATALAILEGRERSTQVRGPG